MWYSLVPRLNGSGPGLWTGPPETETGGFGPSRRGITRVDGVGLVGVGTGVEGLLVEQVEVEAVPLVLEVGG